MEKPRFNCRFNPQNPKHQKAWDVLINQPNGTRTDFVISAILAYEDKDERLKELIVSAVVEGLKGTHIHTEPQKNNDTTIPNEVMGFLDSL